MPERLRDWVNDWQKRRLTELHIKNSESEGLRERDNGIQEINV